MIKGYRHCTVAAGTWRAGEGWRVIAGFSSVFSCRAMPATQRSNTRRPSGSFPW